MQLTDDKPAAAIASGPIGFRRDHLTWQGYLLYGFWSFAWCMFAPAMPFLRNELGFTYAMAGWHFSAMAMGPLLAGIAGHAVIAMLGIASTVWMGIAGLAAGLVLLMTGTNVIATISGGFLVGTGGAFMGQAVIAGLANRFGEERGKPIAEMNVSTSVFATIAPLIFSATLATGISWRYAIVSALVCLAVIVATGWKVNFQALTLASGELQGKRPLPLMYWLFFAVVFFSVAGEWCVCFWCPEFMVKSTGVTKAEACIGLSVISIAMLVGRFIGSRIISAARTPALLLASTVMGLVGFFIFWLTKNYLASLGGLCLLGLGEANMYPLALSAAIGASPGQTAQATTRMFLSTGSAILLAPFALGALADHMGIFEAHGIVAVILTLATLLSLLVLFVCRQPR